MKRTKKNNKEEQIKEISRTEIYKQYIKKKKGQKIINKLSATTVSRSIFAIKQKVEGKRILQNRRDFQAGKI